MELLVLTIAIFKVSFSILKSVVNNPSPVFLSGGFIDTNYVDREFTQVNKPLLGNPYVNIEAESGGLCFYSNKKIAIKQVLNIPETSYLI